MRELALRSLFHVLRALRPRKKQKLRPLQPGDTVLVLQFEQPLGCCVHGTPLLEAVRAAAPGVRVVVATHGMGAQVLRHHPAVDQLVVTKANPLAGWRGLRAAAREIRATGVQPAVVVQDATNRRARLALLAALLRLAPTVGFGDAPRLYDLHLAYDPTLSLIDNSLRIAAALGGSGEHREPAVYFTRAAAERAGGLLACDVDAKGRIGVVLQGSGGQRTAWREERFATVVRRLEEQGYRTVFLGTAVDGVGIERVRELAGSHGVSLAGQTLVTEAAAVLCACDLLISVDTGTMHLGRSVEVPMVVLGPSWQRPLEWLPLGKAQVRVLRGPDRADVPENYQLDEIGVKTVMDAAEELLRLFPPSVERRAWRVEQRLSEVRE